MDIPSHDVKRISAAEAQRRPSWGLIVFLLLASVVMIASFNTEIRLFVLEKASPSAFKLVNFFRLHGNGQELYILGTIHSRHLTTKDYSLLHIEAIIKNLGPDLVLVESRPEELMRDNVGDGPVEMVFANLVARSLGIETGGMDWWNETACKPGRTNPTRDDRMVANILRFVPGHRKVLVLCGFSHVREFIPRLEKAGYTVSPFAAKEKEELFSISEGTEFSFPAGMAHYIRKQIHIAEERAATVADPEWKAAYRNYISSRKQLLKIIEATGER